MLAEAPQVYPNTASANGYRSAPLLILCQQDLRPKDLNSHDIGQSGDKGVLDAAGFYDRDPARGSYRLVDEYRLWEFSAEIMTQLVPARAFENSAESRLSSGDQDKAEWTADNGEANLNPAPNPVYGRSHSHDPSGTHIQS